MDGDQILEEARTRLAFAGEHDLPPVLSKSMDRHRARLLELVGSLRAAGLPEDAVRSSTRAIMASYEEELFAAILQLKDEC